MPVLFILMDHLDSYKVHHYYRLQSAKDS